MAVAIQKIKRSQERGLLTSKVAMYLVHKAESSDIGSLGWETG